MDKLYDQTKITIASIHDLLLVISEQESGDNSVIDELNKKNESLNQVNKKLLSEIAEKDKYITELSEAKEEENKFGMLKAKDKEISNLTKEIDSLKKDLEQANSKLEVMSADNSVSCEMDDVEETPVEETPVEETPVEETPIEETPVEEDNDSEPDDEIEYVTKKINKIRYYVEKDNPNSKIYKILDDKDVGEEVGELINGKKKMY